jgi:hypothetical protein
MPATVQLGNQLLHPDRSMIRWGFRQCRIVRLNGAISLSCPGLSEV